MQRVIVTRTGGTGHETVLDGNVREKGVLTALKSRDEKAMPEVRILYHGINGIAYVFDDWRMQQPVRCDGRPLR